ncbi:tetratricopeptide repeat protein [Chloroflexi bacterium TSY]|nr:tetratricopeptide repeat protein [Chloroflexi bacterium TSY]
MILLDGIECLQDTNIEATILQLVDFCDGIRVLMTSQYTPSEIGSYEDVKPLELSDAENFFIKEAKRTKKDFKVDESNQETITKICKRLDGLPLAIELAAPLKMTLTKILADLDKYLLELKEFRTPYCTLRAVLDQSFCLLKKEEKDCLSNLGVFTGGFTIDDVDSVWQKIKSPDIDQLRAQFSYIITQLIDKNLVKVSSDFSEYELLNIIHKYALERLEESDYEEDIRNAHAQYYGTIAIEANAERDFARFNQNLANIRSGWQWTLEQYAYSASPELAKLVISLAEGTTYIAPIRYHSFRERKLQLEAALDISEKNADSARCSKFHFLLGNAYRMNGDLEGAKYQYCKAADFAAEYSPEGSAELFCAFIGMGGYFSCLRGSSKTSDLNKAVQYFHWAWRLAQDFNDQFAECHALIQLGDVHLKKDEAEYAEHYYDMAANIAQSLSDHYIDSQIALGRGNLYRLEADYEKAKEYYQESKDFAEKIGDRWGIESANWRYGDVLCRHLNDQDGITHQKGWPELANEYKTQ